jgi:hypothetical protein
MGTPGSPLSGSRIQPFPMPSLPAIRAGGVQKSGNGALNRRSSGVSTPRRPAGGVSGVGGGGLLQQQRRQRRRRRTSLDISLSEEEEDEEINDIDTEATEDVDMGGDSDGDYLYTPRSQAPHRYGYGGNGGGIQQNYGNSSLLPPMPNSAPPISRSRRRRSGQCPGAKFSPRNSTATASLNGGGLRGAMMLPGASPFSWSAPSSPHTPHAHISSLPGAGAGAAGIPGRQITADEVAEYDSLDLNFVLSSLVDEPSLTYSANDESYLFESMPVDANHTALVHLNGVELFQHSASVSPPGSPMVEQRPTISSGEEVHTPTAATAVNNTVTTYGNGDFLPGTPLPVTTGTFLGAGSGSDGSGSPQAPMNAGVVNQHSQLLQIPPVMYQRSLPFTSPFAAAF